MWFGLALAAMLCWSGSDFFSKLGSCADEKTSHWRMAMAVGLVMGLHALFEMVVGGVSVSFSLLVRYLPASLCYIGSMILGYVGLRYIELSVSSPICNSSGAAAFLLTLIFLPEQVELSAGPILAVVLTCGGVIALGVVEMREDEETKLKRRSLSKAEYKKTFLALLFPILYCLLDALGTFADIFIMASLTGGDEALAETVARQCNVAYELTFFLMGAFSAVYVLIVRREKLTVPRDLPKGVAGICETIGQFCYAFVMADADHAAFGAAIIASYCAVSAIWARLFLRERMSRRHYAAILATVIGIILLGVFDI